MSKDDLLSEEALPKELTQLGTYCWPQGETTQTLEHIFEKLKSKFSWLGSSNERTEQKLHTFKEQSTIDAAQERLCDILMNCMDETYESWIDGSDTNISARAFVYAPVDHTLLRDWATSRGHTLLEDITAFEPDSDAKVIVIPHLESKLLRQEHALQSIRDTLNQIARAKTKVIVGCNSWAWRYLRSVTGIDMVFERPDTIPAFDALALAALLKPVLAKTGDPEKFMSVDTDKPIFKGDGDGELSDPYFKKLAKRSLGLPSVAIEMFFDDTVSSRDEDGERDDDRTWLKFSAAPKLPEGNITQLCIALHNLLIHGPSDADKMKQFCPNAAPDYLWTTLERAGFIEIDEHDIAHVAVSHYPAVRSALGTAGLNLDKL